MSISDSLGRYLCQSEEGEVGRGKIRGNTAEKRNLGSEVICYKLNSCVEHRVTMATST